MHTAYSRSCVFICPLWGSSITRRNTSLSPSEIVSVGSLDQPKYHSSPLLCLLPLALFPLVTITQENTPWTPKTVIFPFLSLTMGSLSAAHCNLAMAKSSECKTFCRSSTSATSSELRRARSTWTTWLREGTCTCTRKREFDKTPETPAAKQLNPVNFIIKLGVAIA